MVTIFGDGVGDFRLQRTRWSDCVCHRSRARSAGELPGRTAGIGLGAVVRREGILDAILLYFGQSLSTVRTVLASVGILVADGHHFVEASKKQIDELCIEVLPTAFFQD